eukprot:Pompholyxophrys_sp_v1_NODE_1_length_32789_cov_6.460653.p5 type:complete len:476 gc:universal NODE_1_length_32789_cov_6.460653:24455-25882(+)
MPAIRDPVHDWIKCTKAEMQIIDCPLFQRLNWVSQLSCKQIFPGGVHTRFLHSLGAMKLSGQYMSHLLETFESDHASMEAGKNASKLDELESSSDGVNLSGTNVGTGSVSTSKKIITDENRYKMNKTLNQLARLAGLLHDIGHGPFSHAFDRAIYAEIYGIPDGGHDLHRLKMIKSDFFKPLVMACGITPEQLIAVWNSKTEEYKTATPEWQNWYDIIRAIVQGPLGADRMDFTLRDSYFTGTTHLGTIASTRIISNTKLIQDENTNRYHVHYHLKCLSDIIQALSGRYYMYDSVYLHKTTSAAGILIEKMLQHSAKYLNLKDRTEDLNEFQWLNDSTIIGAIMAYNENEGTDLGMIEAKKYCKALLQRKFPKLEVELMIPTEEKFDCPAYLAEYAKSSGRDPSDYEIIRTRSIVGVDADKFDRHHIYFWTTENQPSALGKSKTPVSKISCQDALNRVGYVPAQRSHYIIRIYIR